MDYLISESTAARLREVLGLHDGTSINHARPIGAARQVTHVEILSGPDVDGWHDCVPVSFVTPDDNFTAYGYALVLDANDNPLVVGDRYIAIRAGDKDTSAGPVPVFVTVGTPTPPVCSAVEVVETDVRCESGTTNIYNRTISLNIADGCLEKTTGAWTLLRSAGCCTCTSSSSSSSSSMFSSSSFSSSSSGGGGIVACGCTVPSTIHATITNDSGCVCMAGTYVCVYDSGAWQYHGTLCGGQTFSLTLSCVMGAWSLVIACALWSATPSLGDTSCTPFVVSFAGVMVSGDCCFGTITVVFTS